jgi:dihydrolipoamide dehydrogenase
MKVIVLGGGPAGYVAALRAAQLGADVTVVEKRDIGGTCLNRGCIPTKSMVASVERLRQARDGDAFGVVAPNVGVDFAALMARKSAVSAQLRGGVEQMLKTRKVQVIPQGGRLATATVVELEDGSHEEADAIILCTGSEPVRMPFLPDDPRVVTSDELLEIGEMPRRLAIIGGGVIGCEFAAVFAELGTEVTVIELLDQLLPGEDKRVGQTLQRAFKKRGITAHVKVGVESAEATSGGIELQLANGETVTADLVLQSVGRRPVARGMGFEEAGVEVDRHGFVVVDETLRTAVEGVFAAGDCAGPPLLAHWAYHEGQIAAENAVTGSRLEVDRRIVPNCVFTHPEVASCGLTEDRAARDGIDVKVAHVRFNGNSKAVVEDEADGFVRIVCDAESGVVLGASMVGPKVTELIHEIALAASARLPLDAVMHTIHAHPTLSEAVGEAALSAGGRGMHSL